MFKRVWKENIPNAVNQHVNLLIHSLKDGLSNGSLEKDKW